MTVDRDAMARVAKIARLEISSQELSQIATDADRILSQFESIANVGVATEESEREGAAALRTDASQASTTAEAIRRNFPRQKEDAAIVPRGLR